jgi:hypothetical protein
MDGQGAVGSIEDDWALAVEDFKPGRPLDLAQTLLDGLGLKSEGSVEEAFEGDQGGDGSSGVVDLVLPCQTDGDW